MGAVIQTSTARTLGGPFKLGIDREGCSPTKDMFGLRIKPVTIEKLGGKEDGKLIEDGKIDTRQVVLITPAVSMKPTRYQILVGFNPELLKYGQISVPSVLNYYEVQNLTMQFTALRRTDLSNLDYIFELYMID